MLNETINSIGAVTNISWTYLSNDFYNRCTEVLTAPMRYPEMLWMLLPLLATLILMEFYFGGHKDEELGWNTAFGNALVLLFVAIDLFRHLYEPSGNTLWGFFTVTGNVKVIIPVLIFILGLALTFMDFFHFLPKKIAYAISSPPYINLIGLLGIIIVYSSDILLDWTTVFACIFIFILANLASLLIYYIVPSYTPPLKKILTAEDVEVYGEKEARKKERKNSEE